MYNIDDFDMKILTLLQANGRLTNQELSELVGLSASQCSRRRISLEQAQLIRGYHARLAPEAVSTSSTAARRYSTARPFSVMLLFEPTPTYSFLPSGLASRALVQ